MRSQKVFFVAQHPLFGTKSKPRSATYLERSPFYWWWQYLRRNKRYIGCCERNGKGQLSKLYADFGDVRRDDFKAWWKGDNNRGARLFAEQIAEYTLRELIDKDEWLQEFSQKRVAVIAVNLNLESNRAIKQQFDRWLKKHNPRSRGKPTLGKNSTAMYPLRRNFATPSLKKTLMVYDAIESAKEDAKTHGTKVKPLWKIGHELNLLPHFRNITLDTDARVALSKTTSRYYRVAKELIANTSKGIFP